MACRVMDCGERGPQALPAIRNGHGIGQRLFRHDFVHDVGVAGLLADQIGLEAVAVERLLQDEVVAVVDGRRVFVDRDERVVKRVPDDVRMRGQRLHGLDDVRRDGNGRREVIRTEKQHVPVIRHLRDEVGEARGEIGGEERGQRTLRKNLYPEYRQKISTGISEQVNIWPNSEDGRSANQLLPFSCG